MPKFLCMVLALVAGTAAGCSSSQSPATTQAGGAGDQSRGPRAGAAPSACRDLPSADDLKQWLTAAPATGGEAGGLFSGRREWAAIVDRSGRICAVAVAT